MSSTSNFCCSSFREILSQIEIVTFQKIPDLEHIRESKFFCRKKAKTEKNLPKFSGNSKNDGQHKNNLYLSTSF